MANGSLIGIVNSDDWYEHDTIEQAVTHYQGNPYEAALWDAAQLSWG